MIEVQLFIPVADNDGETFTPAHDAAFEAYLLDRFGGFSRLPGAIAGKWLNDGMTYTDTLVAYLVAMNSITEGSKLAEVVAFAKAHYCQEAIFVRYLGVAEVL